MKTRVFMYAIVLSIFACPFMLNSQNIAIEKTHTLSKEAKNGSVVSFKFDEPSKKLFTVFYDEKKGKSLYEFYEFDYDLNQTAHESLAETKLKEKGVYNVAIDDAPWTNLKSLSVDPNLVGKLKLKVGNISRETHWKNGVKYYEFLFNPEKEVEPELDIQVEGIPNGTPKGIVNMINKQANKLYLTAWAADDPNQGGFHFTQQSKEVDFSGGADYSAASGNLVVVGYSQYALKNKMNTNYYALKFDASDASQKALTQIPFEYEVQVLTWKILADGTLGLIFIPQSGKKCAKPENPNAQEYTYVNITKDATIKQQINFTSPGRYWAIENMILTNDGAVYLYGLANTKYNDAYKVPIEPWKEKFEMVQLAKIKDNKVVFIESTPLEKLKSKVVGPGNQKKTTTYSGDPMAVNGGFFFTSAGNIMFGGVLNDRSAIHFFQFDGQGKFQVQYAINAHEVNKDIPLNYMWFPNTDGKTFTCLIHETASVSESGNLTYPYIMQIDPDAMTINNDATPGYSKSGQYFSNNNFPFLFIENSKQIVFLSLDKKNQTLYLARVKLGK